MLLTADIPPRGVMTGALPTRAATYPPLDEQHPAGMSRPRDNRCHRRFVFPTFQDGEGHFGSQCVPR